MSGNPLQTAAAADNLSNKPSVSEKRSRKKSVFNNPPDIKVLAESEGSRFCLETPPYKNDEHGIETRTRKVSFSSTRPRASSISSTNGSDAAGVPRRPRKMSVSSMRSAGGVGDYRKQSVAAGWRRNMGYGERGSVAYGGDWMPDTRKTLRFANTYKMTSDKPFSSTSVRNTIETELEQYFSGLTYEPSKMGAKAKLISDDIKQMVKLHSFGRYKIVCTVTLGQSTGQGFRESSRCLWDIEQDGCVTVSHDNGNMFVVVTVFAVFHE